MRVGKRGEDTGKRRYDAFISYCHGGKDSKLAERLQVLLESYRLPKSEKRLRVFRDNTELTAGSDLGGELREALERSRYLISVCSEKTRDSQWCMEEIRQFKELHRGSTENILILLTSGTPETAIPEPLRTNGKGGKLEPLYVDVRGGTLRESLRTLKSEYYKLAAALLECGLDDLLQRNRRRRRRRTAAAAAGAFALLSAVLAVVSVFAYRTWISENQYRLMLAGNFAQEGARRNEAGEPQEALANYSRALSLDADQSTAKSGAALLLQDRLWPVLEEKLSGRVWDGRFLPLPQAAAGDPESGYYFTRSREQSFVIDGAGKKVEELGPDFQNLQGISGGWWTFLGEDALRFYHPETGQRRVLPYPTESSAGCGMEYADFLEKGPRARTLPDGRAVAAYLGMVYLYGFDQQGRAAELGRADLADAFPVDAGYQGISDSSEIWLSEDGGLALVSSYASAAVYDTARLELKASVTKYRYGLMGADIGRGGRCFALAYGNPYRIDRMNPGGMFEVWSTDGTCLFSSPAYEKEAFLGTAFHPEDEDILLVWSAGAVHIWNWREGREIAAPIRRSAVSGACFGEDGAVVVEDGEGTAAYALIGPVGEDAVSLPEECALPMILKQHYLEAEGPEGMTAAIRSGKLVLLAAGGEELAAAKLPAMAERTALSPDFQTVYLYSHYAPVLIKAAVDFQAGTLGELRQLDAGGETILGLWCGNDWAAVETGSRAVLLFDGAGEQIGRIVPERQGNIAAVRMDGEKEHMVLIQETAGGAADSFHVEKGGAVEIWDVPSGKLLDAFTADGGGIDAAGILEDGSLAWSAGGETLVRRLRVPPPDETALAFLENLGCLTLDGRQELVPKVPGGSGFQVGNWSVLGDWEKARYFQEEPPLGDSGLAALASAGDLGSEEWFGRCDDLWRRLLAGEEAFGSVELDGLYSVCEKAAENSGRLDCLKPGLEAYIELTLRLIQGAGDSEVVSAFDIKMLETLAATTAYDGTIAQACRDIASLSGGGTADNGIEGYADMMAYSAGYFDLLADALTGNGYEAARALAEFCSSRPALELYQVTPLTLVRLYEGDSQAAAGTVSAWLEDCDARMPGNRDVWLDQIQCSHLFYGALVQRGEIDAAVWEDYLLRLDVS